MLWHPITHYFLYFNILFPNRQYGKNEQQKKMNREGKLEELKNFSLVHLFCKGFIMRITYKVLALYFA